MRYPRRARALLAALIIIAAAVLIARVALDPLATHLTRRGLDRLEGYRGELAAVHVTILPPGYTVTRLKLWEAPGGSPHAPLLYAERVHVGIAWRELLHARLVAGARLEDAKVIIARRPAAPNEKKAPPPAPDLSQQLERLTPLQIARVEILRAELLFRDLTEEGHPELWLHRLDAAAENLATRPELAHGRPTTVSAHGRLGRSGDVEVFVSADPFARPLSFAGRFEVRGFRAAELYDLLEPKTKLQTPKGTIDLFAEFVAKDGHIKGGVKPVLRNIEVAAAEPSAWKRLEAWAADKAIHLFSDRVPERNAVATVVPIEGRLTGPDVQLWPAVLGVVRNAFVAGVTSGFANLPPRTALKKESVPTQAKHALEKSNGPPKAQPTGSR
jgi:hypothetical protein